METTDATMRLVDDASSPHGAPPDGGRAKSAPAAPAPLTEADARTRMTALFDSSYADLVRFVRARTAPDRVDDVVAESYLTAWRRFAQVPPELDGARAWLFTTTRYLLLNDGRRAAREAIALRIDVGDGATPYDGAPHGAAARPAPEPADPGSARVDDDVAARLDMAAALRALTPADQEALALTAVDGLGVTEAAAVLGLTPNTFAARLSRARARLRARLAPRTTGDLS